MSHLDKYINTVYTSLVGATAKDTVAGISVGVVGLLGSFVGGWDQGMKFLLLLMAADYATGILGAIKVGGLKNVSSDVMYWGGIRKIVVIVVIAIAFSADQYLNQNVLRTGAIFYYIGREGWSIFENLNKIGLSAPSGLLDFFKGKDDKKDE